MEKILTKKSFPKWLEKLDTYQIYAPVLKAHVWSYEIVDAPEKIKLDHPNTVQAPKKIICPQRDVLLEFTKSDDQTPEIKEITPKAIPAVIFGVRPCDAKALKLMDKVFLGDFKDLYYQKRRDQTTLVGLACNTPPSPNCFCTSVNGSPHSKEGFDMLMTDMGESYHLESLTKAGDQLLHAGGRGLFTDPSENDKKELQKIHSESEKKIKREIKETGKIPHILKGMFNSPFWYDV